MSNNKNHRRRSNSLDLNLNQNSEEHKDVNEDLLNKPIVIKKKEMITYKSIQNIDLTTYDYIFAGRQFLEGTIQDFCSFIQYLNSIKSKYNPLLMKNNDINETIKKEGKFSLTHDNITKLILFQKKKNKNIEISNNTRYIKIYDLEYKDNYINLYATKSLFKGKHCFEIEILNKEKPNLFIGLINIKKFKKVSKFNDYFLSKIYENKDYIINYEINEPFFIQKKDGIYNHYISYGDILGCCYDFENKLFYLFLNGEIVNTFVLNIQEDINMSFLPIISIGNYTEIIFNPGHNLEYIKSYEMFGFVPLDEKGKNSYEISKLREVTEQFRNILIDNGKKIINSQKISYSNINQIYHIIFDFLGNVSLQHSYIIQNSFIESYLNISNKVEAKDFDLWYLILKYILNLSKDKKLVIKNIFLNLSETIHIYLRKGLNSSNQIPNLLKLFIYLFGKTEIINILSKMPKTLTKIFRSVFVSFHIYESKLGKNNFDFIINQNHIINISNNNNIISLNMDNNNNNNNIQSNNNINNDNRINNQNIDMKRENTQYNNNNNNNSNNSYFPNIIISKRTLKKIIDSNQINLITNSKEIVELYSQFIIILFKNGTENEKENKSIFNVFKKFYEEETDIILKTKNKFPNYVYKFYDLFKNVFISAMKSFNNEYKNKNRIISIKKYLSENEVDGEKIGGEIKHIYEEYASRIPNFENLIKYKINNYDNIIFIELLHFFFVKESCEDFWNLLISIIIKMTACSNINFLKNFKNESFEKLHSSLFDYINFNLYLINFCDLEILIQFLDNLSHYILNELYPQKLIYFIPEKIILRFENALNFIKEISSFMKFHLEYILIRTDKGKFNSSGKEELISKLMKLNEKCFRQYLSILIKIKGDKNIKNISLKCDCDKILKKYLNLMYLIDLNLNLNRNGKVKEYNYEGKLEFEGEYLNGKRNGKGEEYYENKNIKFKGEYLDGKKWNGNGYNINGKKEFEIKDGKGNIKEYNYYDGQLEFEGEYLNGEITGKVKEYNLDGNLEFEGEYLNGKRNGKGKEYYENKNIKFKGEYLDGKKWDGNGYNINGNKEFEIKDGKGNIKEYDYYDGQLEFEGEYLNGEITGKGKKYFNGKLKFDGEYLNGVENGKGKEYYQNGNLIFEGEYINGKRWNGNGYNINGNIDFIIKNGNGNIKEYDYFDDKLEFEGEYLNGERNGKGKEYNFDGKLVFDGEYLNGKKIGIGKEYNYVDKLIFEGEYLNGERNGKGKEYNFDGKLVFEGEYLNGVRIEKTQ